MGIRPRHRYAGGLAGALRAQRAKVVAAGLVAVAVVSGGSADGDDPPTASASASSSSASVSPSVTATPSPSETGPAIPKAAQAHTEAGAVAFFKFFVDQVNESYMTPRDDLIPLHSETDCQSCKALNEQATELVSEKQRSDKPPFSATAVSVQPSPIDRVRINLTMVTNPVIVLDASGAEVSRQAKASEPRTAVISWKGGRWLVYAVA